MYDSHYRVKTRFAASCLVSSVTLWAHAEPATTPATPAPTNAPAAAQARGKLEGRLLERGTRKPIIGASVSLPELGLETLTDAEGGFAFADVPAAKIKLILQDQSHAQVEDEELVEAGRITRAVYYAEMQGFGDEDIVVVGKKLKKEVTRREIPLAVIETVPGSNGDVLKAAQNLPGVARTSNDQIVFRGGGASAVYVNGFMVPSAFHFLGVRSTVGNGLIESLQVIPGNYDARYGNANGGIVDIQTRSPRRDGLHGYAQVDLFDASAFVESKTTEHGAVALGARRSYIDTLLPLFLSDEDKETFQTAPRYYDYQGSYDWKKGKQHLRLNLFGTRDRMVLLLKKPPVSDPGLHGTVDTTASWITGQASWDYRLNERTQLSMGSAYLREDVGGSVGPAMRFKYTGHHFSVRADVSHQMADAVTLRAGVDAYMPVWNGQGTSPRLPKEGEPESSLSRDTILETNTNDTFYFKYQPAAYVAADVQLGKVLLVPGVRVSHFSFVNTFRGATLVQPRLMARAAVTEDFTLKGGLGLYSAPVTADETDPVFGNPNARPETSAHYSLGFEQRFSRLVSLDMVGFYKRQYGIVQHVDDPGVHVDNVGRGRSYGMELRLLHDPGTRFYGWVAYTLMRAERRAPRDASYRVFDLDQTHNLNVVGQYRLTRTWEIGARFRYVTGNPTSPIVGAVYDSDADSYAPLRGATNDARLGAFHQLDVRVDKHFVFDTWQLTAYLDVQNIYNHKSPDKMSYNYNYTESKPVAGLPLIPSFGIRGEF